MKTITLSKNCIHVSLERSALLFVSLLTVCLGLLPNAQAISPAPDGGYPGGNTAEGQNALLSLTTGGFNAAVGWLSLRGLTTGSFNTAVGAGTLALNNGDENTAVGTGALLFNTTGANNTANGALALFSNTMGEGNTATGAFALFSNTEGQFNTANGEFALYFNTMGERNTAIGDSALYGNTHGNRNTANGNASLLINTTGNDNTAIGVGTLFFNNADGNTAIGANALSANTTGAFNTAIGLNALLNNTTGTNNIALGGAAGDQITTSDDNIDIGNNGQFSDSATIRIGQVQTATFIVGISGVNEGGSGILPVYINNLGRLGTQPPPSSRRFKKEIKPMDRVSEAILALKPVAFHYHSDPAAAAPQFGLIAEEVAEVNPDLVVRDEQSEIYSVRYEAVNAMLLNEFLKEHRKVEEQEATITKLRATAVEQEARVTKQEAAIALQQKQVEALTEGLQKVSAQLAAASPSRGGLEMSRPASKIVLKDQ